MSQLLRRDGDLVAYVYESHVLNNKSPTMTTLEQLLRTLLTSMPSSENRVEYLWIVIDGLDECELDKQTRLVGLINQVLNKHSNTTGTIYKALFSSRHCSDSHHRLQRKSSVSLAEEKHHLRETIRQYICQRLEILDTTIRQLDMEEAEIEEIQIPEGDCGKV